MTIEKDYFYDKYYYDDTRLLPLYYMFYSAATVLRRPYILMLFYFLKAVWALFHGWHALKHVSCRSMWNNNILFFARPCFTIVVSVVSSGSTTLL